MAYRTLEENDLVVSFMIAAPQPMNVFIPGYCCFYQGEFYPVYQLPDLPVFSDLIISLQSQIFFETFSGVRRILTRPRHLPWVVLNLPSLYYKKVRCGDWKLRYDHMVQTKEVLYSTLIERNIKLLPALAASDEYRVFMIGYNIVKMKLGKFIGDPVDKAKLHKENLGFLRKLEEKGIKVNYGESVLENRFGIKIN